MTSVARPLCAVNSNFVSGTLAWADIESITNGKLGRTMAACPLCSDGRRTAQKRHSKVLAVNLVEPEFAVYYCNHCEAQGYCRPQPRSRVIDLAEQQRRREEAKRHAEKEKQNRARQALAIWKEAQSFRGSAAEDYLLRTRRIGDWLDTFPYLDQVFHFHPACPFGDERLPCLLALVRDIKTNTPVAIHRTALTADNPPHRIERRSLGPTGGGAIKILSDHDVHSGLLIGEGIETTLSASKWLKFKPCWSVIDKNGIANFPVLSGIESVTIAVDNDFGREGQKAAATCIERLTTNGIEVITTKPNRGGDFNDII
jgi:putative DNA primase/helicase